MTKTKVAERDGEDYKDQIKPEEGIKLMGEEKEENTQ